MKLTKAYIGNTNVKKIYIGSSKVSLTSATSNESDYFIKTSKSGEFKITLSSYYNNGQSTTIDFGNGLKQTIYLTNSEQSIAVNYNDSSEKLISIDTPGLISSLICNDMDITEIKLISFNNLEKIVCFNNNISTLDFSSSPLIQFIHCFNNPIVTDDINLTNMINSLPDRTNKAYGSIIIDNNTQRLKVEPLSIQKDWLFGSAIMYDETEWAKCGYHFKQTGVADIWESAEKGEGLLIAIIDSGFDLNCQEYSSTSITSIKNYSNQGGSSVVPLPTSGTAPYHGNSTSNILMAKGVNMYGICPKANYILIKACDTRSICYTNWVSSAINYAKSSNVDLVTMSLSFPSPNYTLKNSVKNLCLPNNKRSYIGIPLVCSNANKGDNNSYTDELSYPGAYKYPISCGAINSSNNIASWSPSYDGIDIVSYGVSVFTQKDYNTYCTISGTSFSTPISAGIVGLLINILIKKLGRKPSENEIYSELIKRTIPMGLNQKSCGVGRLMLTAYNDNPNIIEHT